MHKWRQRIKEKQAYYIEVYQYRPDIGGAAVPQCPYTSHHWVEARICSWCAAENWESICAFLALPTTCLFFSLLPSICICCWFLFVIMGRSRSFIMKSELLNERHHIWTKQRWMCLAAASGDSSPAALHTTPTLPTNATPLCLQLKIIYKIKI